MADLGLDSSEEEADAKMDKDIEISDEEPEDNEAQRAEAARKVARKEEKKPHKVRTSKISLQ